MKKRRVSDEEDRLWRRVMRDVRAYDSPHKREDPDALLKPQGPGAATTGVAGRDHKSPKPSVHTPSAHKPPARNLSAYGAGDPRLDRLAGGRRLAIERTLDLHGLTQAEAHPRLATFIRQAHQAGCRCVLIITGKGGPASASNMTKARTGGGIGTQTRTGPGWRGASDEPARQWRPGVLRARAPEWIDAPDLRPLVARLAPARPKDGGAGAFYVFLKSPKRRV